jgi:general secretion pathway protein G
MILARPTVVAFHGETPGQTPVLRRRNAFTLLEVLVVVAIIMTLAGIATVATMQILKENKADTARIKAQTLATALKTYMIKNSDAGVPQIADILRYVDNGTNDPNAGNDPWGKPYQIGTTQGADGVETYYIFTTNPDNGETIASNQRK